MQSAELAQRFMRYGVLTRYTYYKGWVRTDDPVAQTAVIQKCDQHQYVALDLAKRTYTITSTQPTCNTSPTAMSDHATGAPSAPGTEDMTVKSTAQNLGPLTIDTVPTNGADMAVEMSITNATGSCQGGAMQMSSKQYISRIAIPRAYCPIVHQMPMAQGAMASSGGCKPTMHVAGKGPNPFGSSDLVNVLADGVGCRRQRRSSADGGHVHGRAAWQRQVAQRCPRRGALLRFRRGSPRRNSC